MRASASGSVSPPPAAAGAGGRGSGRGLRRGLRLTQPRWAPARARGGRPALEAYGVVVRGDEGVQLLLLLANRAALLDVGADCLHAAREVFLALGGEPLFGEAALELLRAAEFAEDQVQLAHDQLEQLDLPVEQLEDVGLDGPRRREVHDMHLARLADAVQAPDALLDHHRVPGEVVIHEHVAELEVASFAAGAGGDQDARPVLVEGADALVPLGGRVSAPVDDGLPAELLHALFDQLNGRAVDRKSTRLNSSHGYISYAVFCLKKKKNSHQH